MNFAFYFGHPAQFLFARKAIGDLINQQHKVLILIKKKDVLEELLNSSGYDYTNILPQERKNTKLSTAISLVRRNRKMYPILRKFKPNLLISSDASFAQLGFILRIPRITILEDDYDVIKPLARLTYPFTSTILCPEVCDVGKWSNKKVGYEGYMKLGYLHPEVFTAKYNVVEKYKLPKKYAIIRLSKLSAYHDEGIEGISGNLLGRIIGTLVQKDITPVLSIEGKIQEKYKHLLLKIEAKDMHDVLAYAKLLICDSQSMSVEASMLGIPSLRYSSFSGRISVLEELEHKYQLTFGFQISRNKELFEKLEEILSTEGFENVFSQRKVHMLKEKNNVSDYLVWFLKNYPNSIKEQW
ncbi:MAG: DUF354 domain-containing protein [Crocinitomicaceae bacterium]|nr:DUF354 domain-containing protein [Flavobacteriales bacterium]NQZ35018.1 DUF354 domain-containing protein [Crocinitomicaceae bacterium]